MSEWIRSFFTTDTLSLQEERKQNRALQKLLADSLKDSQALNRKLVEALDRVVESRFDRPVMPQPMEQPKRDHMDLGDVLSVEDDAEFITRMEQAIA